MCLRSAGNRVTIFGEECTSQWVQSNLPVPGPAAIICDSSKEKKKDKFASLKPLQTWNFLPPCSVLVLGMYVASPASQLHQFGSSLAAVSQLSYQYRLGLWKESPLQLQEPWVLAVLAVLTEERGAGSALA